MENIQAKNTPWYIIYNHLSKALFIFHQKNRQNSGRILYEKCMQHKDFEEYNPWIKKFASRNRKSLDPIHVFGSISARMDDEKRKKRILIYLDILKASKAIEFDEIDFTGCPTPPIVSIISARDINQQQDIWIIFSVLRKSKRIPLNERLLRRVKLWYGVDFRSFTIFLFWAYSNNFLPLDKNTVNLLINQKIIRRPPANFIEYKNLLPFIDANLYRNLALISYNEDAEKSLNTADKKQINKYLGTDKVVSNDFKIIAIKPLSGFNENFLKTIKEEEIYTLYKAYTINDNVIEYDSPKNTTMYDLSNVNLNISISAVVGKNGTGKSTILEILFLAINNISKLIDKSKFKKIKFEKQIHVEIYIKTTNVFKIVLKGNILEIFEFKFDNKNTYSNPSPIVVDKGFLGELFYTIAVNYSLYSLNTKHLGDWIHELFHKNDAYQTPIVIEPFRDDGKIDVNRQEELIKARLLSNLLEPDDSDDKNSFRQLTEYYRAHKLVLKLDKKKFENIFSEKDYLISFDDIKNAVKILEVFLEPYKLEINIAEVYSGRATMNYYSLHYIIKKLVNISLTYPHYMTYFDKKSKKFNKLPTYLKNIQKDNSHITYKLKQTINYLRFNHIKKQQLNHISIEELVESMEENKRTSLQNGEKIKTIELIPPSFYSVDIILFDKENNKDIAFTTMSSGEKQKIYSANSIIYHLKNIDSASEGNKKITSYRYVNIVLDEVELYFHPEMQRTYISHLLYALSKVELINISCINFCFVTHSPFILSDIPNSNILFLEKEKDGKTVSAKLEMKTFGANIHKLLIDGFFMKQTLGDFALERIKIIINFHSRVLNAKSRELADIIKDYDILKSEFHFILNNIGEDYMRGIMQNHIEYIENKLDIKTSLDDKINKLENELKLLKLNRNVEN